MKKTTKKELADVKKLNSRLRHGDYQKIAKLTNHGRSYVWKVLNGFDGRYSTKIVNVTNQYLNDTV